MKKSEVANYKNECNSISWEEIYQVLCKRHTKEIQDQLLKGRVAIAGLGGLGSTIAIALARAGVGHLHLIDFDKVDLSNLNRQQYRIKDLGKFKTDCLKEIIKEINPYLSINTDTIKLDSRTASTIFMQDDIVCEAFDCPETKAMLVDSFFNSYGSEKKLVSASGMAGLGSSNLIQTKKMNSRFYLCGDGISGIENGQSLMAPRVGICACHQANMIIRLLVGKETI